MVSFTVLVNLWSTNIWQRISPTVITWTGTWRHDRSGLHGLAWICCFCGTNYVILLTQNVPNSKYWLSCRLFDANVVCNGGYYRLASKILERISTFFTVEDGNLSVGLCIPETAQEKPLAPRVQLIWSCLIFIIMACKTVNRSTFECCGARKSDI